MSQAEKIEASTSGRTCRGCGVPEHPAAPFTGGLCDRCCIALAAGEARAGGKPTQQMPQPTSGSLNIGHICGGLLMVLGIGMAIAFLGADTSVQTGPALGGRRVHNFALAQQQMIGMLFSLAMFIGGLLLVLFLKKR